VNHPAQHENFRNGASPAAQHGVRRIAAPGGVEAALAAVLRGFLKLAFKRFVRPPVALRTQRRLVGLMEPSMAGVSVPYRAESRLNGVGVQRLRISAESPRVAVIFIHGGAYCLGSPHSHRSITTRLAHSSAAEVVVPDYRLAPEHPYPAAIDDVQSVYEALLAEGRKPSDIVIAGDSAGGALAAALLIRLSNAGQAMPGAAVLISPVADPDLGGETLVSCHSVDPMLHIDWLKQGLSMYAAPASATEHRPLEADLSSWPPTLIQVGELEILRSDSERLHQRLVAQGVSASLEIHEERWHDFHLQATFLASARAAVASIGAFVKAKMAQ
jgi:acetyl esterase/lipase